jgi:hypothetical protein
MEEEKGYEAMGTVIITIRKFDDDLDAQELTVDKKVLVNNCYHHYLFLIFHTTSLIFTTSTSPTLDAKHSFSSRSYNDEFWERVYERPTLH